MLNQVEESASMHAGGRGRWLGLAMLSLGVAMIIVDATIVNVAVPSMIRDLKLDSTSAEWVNAIYTLVFAALLVTLGRMGDVLGRRAMYLAGLVLFVLASMVAGLSSSGEMLIGARLVQGVGGAMILPATQSILNANFRGRDRAIAFGIWGAVIGGMAAIGPLMGGWLTTNLSWRWAFYLNLPVGLIAVFGTLKYIRESRDEDSKLGFDLPGFILVTLGLSGVVFGLIEGRTYGWWAPNATHPFAVFGWTWPSTSTSIVPIAIGGGLAAIILFAIVEMRRQRAGKFFLFDFSLWGFRAFRFGNLAGSIVSLGEFGLLFALPLFLQGVIGYDAFETGLVFLALALGSFVAAPLAVTVSGRWGPRRAVTLGMSLEAVGILLTTFLIGKDTSGLLLAAPLFVYGIGVGLATAQLTSIVLSEIPGSRSGLASGTNSTMRQVGSALGVAILGTVLFATLVGQSRDNLAATLPDVPAQCRELVVTLVDESAGQILPALKNPSAASAAGFGGAGTLPPDQVACFGDPAFLAALPRMVPPIEDAFVSAAHFAGYSALAFVVLGVVFSLLLPDTRHGSERLVVQEALPAEVAASG
jgi:EmrB/QacA subfamily drug resistance transporter